MAFSQTISHVCVRIQMHLARLGVVLELIRWDVSKPGTCDNLVIMSSHAANEFEKNGREGIDPFVRKQIEKRLASCRKEADAI